MKKMFFLVMLCLGVLQGCEDSSSGIQSPAFGSQNGVLGSPCVDSTNCSGELICRSNGDESFCENPSYGTSFTNKSCKIIECEEDWHCYDYVPECQATYEACAEDSESGDCENSPAECAFACSNEKCIAGCTNNNHCQDGFACNTGTNECECENNAACAPLVCGDSGQCECEEDGDRCDDLTPGFVCFDDTCGCDSNSDCGADEICSNDNDQCVPACKNDFECPQLHVCRSGQCKNEGCISDRECAALLRKDVNLVICDADKVCRVRCENDWDCDDDENFNKFERCSGIDVDGDGDIDGGVCKYVGCETSNECKALLFSSFQPGEESRDAIRGFEATCVENGNVDFSRNPPADDDNVNPNDPADPEYGRCDGCNPPEGENSDPDPSR